MKKTYIIPQISVDQAWCESLVAISGVSSDEIGYGGVDTDGTIVPEVKRHHDVWDDEW